MSKNRPNQLQVGKPEAEPDVVLPSLDDAIAADAVAQSLQKDIDRIEPHRRCPLCWTGNHGVGVCYSSDAGKRYYKCVKTLDGAPPCGHTWTAFVRLEVISVSHKPVTLDGTR